jgi:surfactin synthase thioesterase subunit
MADEQGRTRWLVTLANPESSTTAYVFPAGGSGAAAVRGLAEAAASWLRVVAVRLPGREALADLEPLRDVDVAAAEVAHQIQADLRHRPPATVYGHCAGAIFGYEAAALLPPESLAALVVSSHEPPDRIPVSLAWTLPDDDFLARVAQDGFLPEEVLANPELKELALPALRGDYEAVETHVSSLQQLRCPIVAVGGTGQNNVPERDMVAWAERTSGRFELTALYAGRNLLADQPRAMAETIQRSFGAAA